MMVSVIHLSRLGPIRLEANSNGIHRIDLLGSCPKEEVTDEDIMSQIDELNCHADVKNNLKRCIEWLDVYFEGEFDALEHKDILPILDRTDHGVFASKVWSCLEDVLPGQTISYGEVAKLVGSRGAAQAVGQVMKHNRLSLILPCHRVILADGSPGHYSSNGGTKTKEWLLKHEKQT